ncbi:MAG: S1 RNA-binding domain-containing protein, partial [Planctomycetes bacterium]|nr:S1 RNA-binding domain-containing protein [Planctomycetota bacterium]
PLWLRTGDPVLAGLFSDPFAFEILCEKVRIRASFERRLDNLRAACEQAERSDLIEALQGAEDEGELEDVGFSLQAMRGESGEGEAGATEGLDAYLTQVRGDFRTASALRTSFRQHASLSIAATDREEVDRKSYESLIGWSSALAHVPPAKYLQVRRGERAHALMVNFDWPQAGLAKLAEELGGFPPQERDKYIQAFVQFARDERMPRFVQEARASLKRTAETESLRNAWDQIDFALNRGRHQGPVIGLCSARGGKVQAALVNADGDYVRAVMLHPKSDELESQLTTLLGDLRPDLIAYQGDTASRNLAQRLVKMVPKLDASSDLVEGSEGGDVEKSSPRKSRVRQAHVPMSVVRTQQREVARRGAETLLSHDERTAYLVARFAWDPRGAALVTPHIVRSFISFRGEVNPRRMEDFEVTFLRSLLIDKGVEANTASLEVLRMVPGVDAEGLVIERSTASFLSVADLIDRMGLDGASERAALCLLRVRGSRNPLDTRSLHPVYFNALHTAAAAGGVELAELLREPNKVLDLPWEDILSDNGWHKSVVRRVREGLERGGRGRRRPGGPKGGRGPMRGGRRGGKGLDSLEVGSSMKGKVTAVTEYGAFVDVGARTEGLVHISEISDEFVEDPKQVLSVGQEVEARVVSVDLEKQRFRLSLRSEDAPRGGGGGRRSGDESAGNGPSYVRSTRPKGQGGRGQGGRGRGGPGGGHGPGGRGGRPGGKGRRREDDYGKDPKASKKKEEIDPTNPFFQFFSQGEEDKKD